MAIKDTDKRKHNKGMKGKAGRKSIDDKVIPVTVYVKKSRVDYLGGIDAARLTAKKVLQ